MTKRGLTSLAVPGHDPPIDITIFVDVSVNPGRVSQIQVRNYYLTPPPAQQPLHWQSQDNICYRPEFIESLKPVVF